MDYKYIEQLIDRYFECDTTLEEEQILRTFFSQENVPVSLLQYRELFSAHTFAKQQESLPADFDSRILAMIGEQSDKDNSREPLRVMARRVSISRRLRPLYKAVAMVAVVLAIGQAAQMPYSTAEQEQREDFARSVEMLQRIQKDQNTVAQGDTVTAIEELKN